MSPSTPIQGVLYEGVDDTANNANCQGGVCYPGSAVFNNSTSPPTPLTGQDDAFTTEILVDAIPEPTTVGLFSVGLLVLGFARRRFRR